MAYTDVINSLEDKINRLLSYLGDLEEEKGRLLKQLAERDSKISELNSIIETLEHERAEVSGRVERILEKIEGFSQKSVVESDQEPDSGDIDQGSSMDSGLQFADTD